MPEQTDASARRIDRFQIYVTNQSVIQILNFFPGFQSSDIPVIACKYLRQHFLGKIKFDSQEPKLGAG